MKTPHPLAATAKKPDAEASPSLDRRPVNTGLDDSAREAVVRLLTSALADVFVLQTKARNFHWNVTGPNFFQFHEFFEKEYRALDASVDGIAERIRALGGRAIGTLSEMQKNARLKESPGRTPDARGMLAEYLEDNEEIVRRLRKDIVACQEEFKDEGTANFLTDKMEGHEKAAWMVRAALAEASAAGERTLRKVE